MFKVWLSLNTPENEDLKLKSIQDKRAQDMKAMREEMNQQFSQIMSMIQQNPKLAQAPSINKEIMTYVHSI